MPREIVAAMDTLIKGADIDRSKLLRLAIREKLQREKMEAA